jgi:phosphatidylglycerophosphate synthase
VVSSPAHRVVVTVGVPGTSGHASLSAVLRDTARQVSAAGGSVSIISADLRLPDVALVDLTMPRPGPTVAYSAADGPIPVRLTFSRIVEVPTTRHPVQSATTGAVGLIRLADSDLAATVTQINDAADLADQWGVTDDNPMAWVLLAMIRGGVEVTATAIDPWPWTVGEDVAPVAADEARRIQLLRANRSNDGPYSVLVLRRLSKPLSAFGSRHGWSPNAITVASLVIGLAAAGLFALGPRWAMVAGAILLQVSLVVDCSDGEIARLTGKYSTVGAWLDAVTDRVKEYAAYAGLAAGAAVAGMNLWWAAAATMTLQTGRHLCDYNFNRFQQRRETAEVQKPLSDTTTRAAGFTGILPAAVGGRASGPVKAVKRAIHLPIGERWLIISLTAAFLSPAWTFGVLLVAGLLSLAYATGGRFLRTRTWQPTGWGSDLTLPQLRPALLSAVQMPVWTLRGGAALLVLGLVSWVLAAWALTAGAILAAGAAIVVVAVATPLGVARLADWRFAWGLPGLTAAMELLLWLFASLAIASASVTWTFALMFTIAFHRYDLLYRSMAGRPPPRWLVVACAGMDGRLFVLTILVWLGGAAYAGAVPVLAAYLAIVAVVVASVQWVVSGHHQAPEQVRRAGDDE